MLAGPSRPRITHTFGRHIEVHQFQTIPYRFHALPAFSSLNLQHHDFHTSLKLTVGDTRSNKFKHVLLLLSFHSHTLISRPQQAISKALTFHDPLFPSVLSGCGRVSSTLRPAQLRIAPGSQMALARSQHLIDITSHAMIAIRFFRLHPMRTNPLRCSETPHRNKIHHLTRPHS